VWILVLQKLLPKHHESVFGQERIQRVLDRFRDFVRRALLRPPVFFRPFWKTMTSIFPLK
jgi:hypothetical protein